TNSLTYDHTTANNSSGSGTLTQNSAGGDFYMVLSTNQQGQAVRFYGFYKGVSRYFKSDSADFFFLDELGVSDASSVMRGWEQNLLYSGATPGWVFNMQNAYEEFCLGQMNTAFWGGGYGYVGSSSRLIVDQLNSSEND